MSRVAPTAQTAQALPIDPEPALLTVAQAAAVLGWTEKAVRAALERRFLDGFKPGGLPGSRWSVYRWSVEAVAAGQRGVDPDALAGKFRRYARLTAELTALTQEIEDDLRDSTVMRDGGVR